MHASSTYVFVTGHLLRVGSVIPLCASWDSTQVIRLGGERSYPLSHFIVLKFKFNVHAMPFFLLNPATPFVCIVRYMGCIALLSGSSATRKDSRLLTSGVSLVIQ